MIDKILRRLGLCRVNNVVEALTYLRDIERAVGPDFQFGDRHGVSAMRMAVGLPRVPNQREEILLTAKRQAAKLAARR